MDFNYILLTKESGILKPFAIIIGYIIEGLYWILDKIGIPNIGLSIIFLTLIIYILMIPLTYKQQKFSKLSAKMNPELQAIQAKYKNKGQDQETMMRMQSETQLVYAKYGVSPTGSCAQMLITMPILFALYRVIYNIPAYITSVGNVFRVFADKIIASDNAQFLRESGIETIDKTVKQYGSNMIDGNMSNGVIDVLNRLSTSDLNMIADHYGMADATFNGNRILSTLDNTMHIVDKGYLDRINTFLGLNISNSPSYTLTTEWNLGDNKNWLIILGVLLIPLLSALTQFINVKLMPQPETGNKPGEENAMMSSMKTMNTIMPLFSAFICYTLPVGIGIYWIAGSVIRTIIQIILNKKIDKIDIDKMIKDNIEKNNKKREMQGLPQQTLNNNATLNTKNVDRNQESKSSKKSDFNTSVKDSTEYYKNSSNVKEGSLASKAFMVKNYNEKQNKDK